MILNNVNHRLLVRFNFSWCGHLIPQEVSFRQCFYSVILYPSKRQEFLVQFVIRAKTNLRLWIIPQGVVSCIPWKMMVNGNLGNSFFFSFKTIIILDDDIPSTFEVVSSRFSFVQKSRESNRSRLSSALRVKRARRGERFQPFFSLEGLESILFSSGRDQANRFFLFFLSIFFDESVIRFPRVSGATMYRRFVRWSRFLEEGRKCRAFTCRNRLECSRKTNDRGHKGIRRRSSRVVRVISRSLGLRLARASFSNNRPLLNGWSY